MPRKPSIMWGLAPRAVANLRSRKGRRAKKPWEGRNWRNFGLGAVPHSFAEFKRAINEGRKEKTWYEWSGLVSGKDVRLKGYEKWLQIYVVDGVDYSTGMGIDTVREFNEALAKPFLDYFYSHEVGDSNRMGQGGPEGEANIEQAPGLRPRARCDVSCKTCVHYLAKGHSGKGYCQLYDFWTFKKWVCDSWKGQGVYSHEP